MRNTIARAFPVVASTHDIAFPPSSRLDVLPPLCTFLWCIAHALCDEQQKVWTMSALGLTAFTEAAAPDGIGLFDNEFEPLSLSIHLNSGRLGLSLTALLSNRQSVACTKWRAFPSSAVKTK